jgi:hypothetical protein
LGYAFRAGSLLFRELDRLKILEVEFFASNRRLLDKTALTPDPELRRKLFAALDTARSKAGARLAKDSKDRDGLYGMTLAAGLATDYLALVEKRQWGIFSYAKESHAMAVRLLHADPEFADAYLTTAMTEYFLGSVPFFVKWFLRFEQAQGSKQVAVERLERVVAKGKYLGPFAKILLAVIDLREKRPRSAEMRLVELCREFPENPLFRKELERLRPKMR